MIAALILTLAMYGPVMEYSDDGLWMRIYNPTPDPFFCWAVLDTGRSTSRILYGYQASPWRKRGTIADWGCE
jgi:hypothetical protein